ncbi:hypothetical protein OQA88_2552 [Cercophora sp. LCS_1]
MHLPTLLVPVLAFVTPALSEAFRIIQGSSAECSRDTWQEARLIRDSDWDGNRCRYFQNNPAEIYNTQNIINSQTGHVRNFCGKALRVGDIGGGGYSIFDNAKGYLADCASNRSDRVWCELDSGAVVLTCDYARTSICDFKGVC